MNTIHAGDHVGVAFATATDFTVNTVDFARDGLAADAHVSIFPADGRSDDLKRTLATFADLDEAISDGRMDFGDSATVQRAPGHFDPTYLRDEYSAATAQTTAAGFSGLWISVDMAWATPDFVTPEQLVKFEAESFPLFASGELTAVCHYDLQRFTTDQATSACRAHPCTGDLRLRREISDDGTQVRLSGETDLGNYAAWAAMLHAVGPYARLDLTGTTFVDVAGLREVVRTATMLPGLILAVTENQARRLRTLGLTETTDRVLEIVAR